MIGAYAKCCGAIEIIILSKTELFGCAKPCITMRMIVP